MVFQDVPDCLKQFKANAERLINASGHKFTGTSSNAIEIAAHPELELSYITAVPRMAHYMEHSTRIYNIYFKYIAPEDIHVYSIDEVFIDLTHYLSSSGTKIMKTFDENVWFLAAAVIILIVVGSLGWKWSLHMAGMG